MINDHDYIHTDSSSNEDEDDGSQYKTDKPRKKAKNVNRRDKIHKLIAKGQEHETQHKKNGEFRIIEARVRKDNSCSVKCKPQCKSKLSEEEKQSLFKNFWAIGDHNVQIAYLRGCTRIVGRNRKGFIYQHHLQLPERTLYVCQKYLTGVFGLTRSFLQDKVLDLSKPIMDMRGKHTNHLRMDPVALAAIRKFLGTYPSRESHYSRRDNMGRKFLNSNLSIKELHREFLTLYPEYDDVIKYSYFYDKFNKEFNLAFGVPRSDVCPTCDTFYSKIATKKLEKKDDEVRQLRQNQKLHWVEAEAFYTKLKAARGLDESYAAIAIDFEKQLQLPRTNVGPEYYKSQLNTQTFCIANIQNPKATMYVYAEIFAARGSCEVIAMIDDYLSKLPKSKRHVIIFADNCGAQNKNRFMFAYLQNLVDSKKFETISLCFPIPGHSRLPCDRLFGIIQKFVKNLTTLLLPSHYISCLKKCKTKDPFEIKYVNFPFTDNLKTDGTPVVIVKNFEPELSKLLRASEGNIQQIRSMKFSYLKDPQVSYNVQETSWVPFKIFRDEVTPRCVSNAFATAPIKNKEYLKLPANKCECIRYLIGTQLIPSNVTFYNAIQPDNNISHQTMRNRANPVLHRQDAIPRVAPLRRNLQAENIAAEHSVHVQPAGAMAVRSSLPTGFRLANPVFRCSTFHGAPVFNNLTYTNPTIPQINHQSSSLSLQQQIQIQTPASVPIYGGHTVSSFNLRPQARLQRLPSQNIMRPETLSPRIHPYIRPVNLNQAVRFSSQLYPENPSRH